MLFFNDTIIIIDNDYLILQDDLSNLVRWADKLGLQFNTIKCHSMTFTHLKSPLKFNDPINGFFLQ